MYAHALPEARPVPLRYSNGLLGLVVAPGNLLGTYVSLTFSARIDREEKVAAKRLIPLILALQTVTALALPASPAKAPITPFAFVATLVFLHYGELVEPEVLR